jgi:DNA-binding PadR family transcriptional regulator
MSGVLLDGAGGMGPEEVADLLPLTDLAFNILVSLKGEELHGYGLVKVLRSRGGRGRLRTGTVYAALSRLQDDGLVEESPGPPAAEQDDRRRYYRLTPLGVAAARAEARRLQEVLAAARANDLLAGGEG